MWKGCFRFRIENIEKYSCLIDLNMGDELDENSPTRIEGLPGTKMCSFVRDKKR